LTFVHFFCLLFLVFPPPLQREYGLADQEVEVMNGCPAISREEEVEEPHEDDDKDCKNQLAIKVKRLPDLDNLEADDANDVDDDDGLPRGFSTSTTTPLPPPSRASSTPSPETSGPHYLSSVATSCRLG